METRNGRADLNIHPPQGTVSGRRSPFVFNKPRADSAQDQTSIPIRRFPTRLHVRCVQCQHQGFVVAFLDRPPKLRCTRCGNRDPIITDRDCTRTWKRGAGR
jgi:hypothetical protein